MQKINLGSIIFSIHDSAYQILKSYRLELYRYFVQQPDGEEILADLEHHIVEIFWETTLSNAMCITEALVKDMIARMGVVADFEEASQNPAYTVTYQEALVQAPRDAAPVRSRLTFAPYPDDTWNLPTRQAAVQRVENDEVHDSTHTPKRLYRDTKRAVLGGVAAGFGYYFQIDIVWVRLACLGVAAGLIPTPSAISTAVFMYGLLWAALPKNAHLPEIETEKRLCRNLEEGRIAGICAGISDYFGWRKKHIRTAFVISGCLGIGVALYAALWVIMPKKKSERKSISENLKTDSVH